MVEVLPIRKPTGDRNEEKESRQRTLKNVKGNIEARSGVYFEQVNS
jgi:hypothetical protein